MASIDPDRTSIVSKRSIASIASILWPKIPRSSKTISTPLAHICSYIEATPDAQSSPIKELIVHKEEDGVQHEFLLLRLAKPTGEEFWVRLERKARIGTLSKLISSKSEANDMATLSGKRDTLLGSTKSVEKTRIIFRVPPSLTDLFHVLEALRESSKFYQVWPQNCYFFASVVTEHLSGLDKSAELTGTLRWLDLGADARRRIYQIIASHDPLSVQDPDSESESISPPESLASKFPIDVPEIENMSSASGTSQPRSLCHSQSQMPAYSTDHPLKRVPSFADSLLSSDDQNDHSSPPSVRRPTEDIIKNIPHRGDTEYTLGIFCTETHHSEEAETATVTRLLRYGTRGRVAHRFLLLEVMKLDIKFWIRLDRHPRLRIWPFFYMGTNDLVKITMALHHLLGKEVQREAVVEFCLPIPLKRLVRALDVIREESIVYALSRKNCWFFVSIIQEISVGFLGGHFSEEGQLNNPSLADGRRRAIKERVYKVLPTLVPTLVTEVVFMAAMTHDKLLIEAISQLAQIVKDQDKLLLCSGLDEARLRFGRQSSLIRLLSESKMVLYEHLHRLSNIPGARGFRSGFPRDLADRLNSWVSSVGGDAWVSECILDQNQMDKLDAEVSNLFSGAFEKEAVHVEGDTSATPLKLQWKGRTSSSSTDLDLALWTLQHLSHCKSLLELFGKHWHRLKKDVPDF
ncbi:uncharacterized protein EI90DRAFT_3126210 [Cantharellus anzutake]|uniref:uncharacterized protein n=1 Tax=Cantharellus anzutake TaxID=1750568 RepID=UPI0019044969|nr:uncharacterized protein EI90DRAFT_3126210 [Cantharellus anzutake]KAF8328427.1 hypothetical protein EI90DRAFT_3126210 [Cantharellus anzutake]